MSKEIVQRNVAEVPDYLRSDAPMGLDEVRQYQSISRVKILQAMTAAELTDRHGVGSLIVQPDDVLVAKVGEPAVVVPVYSWASWTQWRDAEDRSEPPIVEETTDAASDIARRAGSFKDRVEAYGDGFEFRYVSNLNFAVEIQTGDAAGIVAVLTYSRGSYKDGQRLVGYLTRTGVDIYANRVQIESVRKTNTKKQTWYVPNFGAPEGSDRFVSKPDYERLKRVHEQIKAAHRAGAVRVAEDGDAPTTDGDLPI